MIRKFKKMMKMECHCPRFVDPRRKQKGKRKLLKLVEIQIPCRKYKCSQRLLLPQKGELDLPPQLRRNPHFPPKNQRENNLPLKGLRLLHASSEQPLTQKKRKKNNVEAPLPSN